MTVGIFWPRSITADPPPVVVQPPVQNPMILGCNWHAAWAEQSNDTIRGNILDKMVSWGCKSVRLDFAWDGLEPTKGNYTYTTMDKYVNDAYTRGMTVLVMLYWPPAWASSTGTSTKRSPPSNPAEFGNICGRIGARYGTKLVGVEMWNEPDISTFWSGTRPQFAQLLAGAYPVAKALSPSTTFIAAAPTYVGLASGWMSDMYTNANYRPGVSFDAHAVHPYMSPMNTDPTDPKTNWSVRAIEDVQALRAAKGDTSPLWATEFGWSTHPNVGGEEPWQMGVTDAEQADYIPKALTLMAGFGVKAAYLYTEKDMSQTSEPHERNFGLTRVDYSEKPVVPILRSLYTNTGSPPPTAAIVGGSAFTNVSSGAGTSSLTMTLPTGLQNGDEVFIVAVCADSNTGCVITENKTGWTTVTAKADIGTMQRVMYRATYSGSLVAPSWTLSTARKVAYACVGVRYADPPQEAHSDGGGLTSTAPTIAAAPVGLGLRFYVRKDNLSADVATEPTMTPITGSLGGGTGPSCHCLIYSTSQPVAGAMAAAVTTWPITSINSTAWTIAI